MIENHRIAFVIVYFGTFPFWMPAFLRSCRMNPDVDWLIFSDAPVPEEGPPNVRFIRMALSDFNNLCRDKIGMDGAIDPAFSYKLCDFKPAYGAILEDYLADYDFWGHCDIDMVWGHVRTFFDRNVLAAYDVVNSRPRRISGHGCLYRNTERYRNLFREIPGVAAMLRDTKVYRKIDEHHLTLYLKTLLSPTLLGKLRRCFKREGDEVPRVYWDRDLTTSGSRQRAMLAKNGCFRWERGRAYDEDMNEILYIHFHKIRATMHTLDFPPGKEVGAFTVTPEGLFAVE